LAGFGQRVLTRLCNRLTVEGTRLFSEMGSGSDSVPPPAISAVPQLADPPARDRRLCVPIPAVSSTNLNGAFALVRLKRIGRAYARDELLALTISFEMMAQERGIAVIDIAQPANGRSGIGEGFGSDHFRDGVHESALGRNGLGCPAILSHGDSVRSSICSGLKESLAAEPRQMRAARPNTHREFGHPATAAPALALGEQPARLAGRRTIRRQNPVGSNIALNGMHRRCVREMNRSWNKHYMDNHHWNL